MIYQVDTKVRYSAQKPARRRKYKKKKKKRLSVWIQGLLRKLKASTSLYHVVSTTWKPRTYRQLNSRSMKRDVIVVTSFKGSTKPARNATPRKITPMSPCTISFSFLNSFFTSLCNVLRKFLHTVYVFQCQRFVFRNDLPRLKYSFSNVFPTMGTRKIIKRDCRYPRQCWLRIFLYLHKNKHNLYLCNKL